MGGQYGDAPSKTGASAGAREHLFRVARFYGVGYGSGVDCLHAFRTFRDAALGLLHFVNIKIPSATCPGHLTSSLPAWEGLTLGPLGASELCSWVGSYTYFWVSPLTVNFPKCLNGVLPALGLGARCSHLTSRWQHRSA